MESYKFYIIHVLLDTVLAAIVFSLFYVGWSNALSIAAVPNTVVLLLICFIGYKTITMKGFINSLADVSVTILVYIGYLYAVRNGDDLLQKNYWFVQVFRGFAFASFAVLLITFVKRYVSAYLKYAQIYYVSCGHKGSVLQCFSGAVSCFKSSVCVPIFTKLIHKGFSTVFDICKGKSDELTEKAGVFGDILDNVKGSKIMQAGTYVSKIYLDYADECVLAYCYQHPENSLLKNSLTAMTVFFKNCVEICSRIAVVSVFRLLAVGVIWISGIAFFVTKFNVTFYSTVCAYVFIKLIVFIVSDAMLHPLMMNVILEAFCNSKEEEYNEALLSELPFMEAVRKYDSSGILDDLHRVKDTVGENDTDISQENNKFTDTDAVDTSGDGN